MTTVSNTLRSSAVGEEIQKPWLVKQQTTSPSQIEGTEIRDSERLNPCTTTMLA